MINDDKAIRICDMTDSHLINSIKFIKRKWENDSVRLLSSMDMLVNPNTIASDIIDDAINSFCDGEYEDEMIEETFPIYSKLLDELDRRNLSLD